MTRFSYETETIIREMEESEKRKRVSRLTSEEKEELLELIDTIVSKYKLIIEDISFVINNKDRKYPRFKVSNSELYYIDSIISSNHFDSKPQVVKDVNGRLKKKYNCYRIKRIARIFYVANYVGKDCIEKLITIPDVHFALTQIRNDEFGQLEKFLSIETPNVA